MANMAGRYKTTEQDPKVRARNFDEVSLGFDEETARLEAQRCLNCKNPKCMEGCPVGVKIPTFIKALAEGRNADAIAVIKETSNLPGVCGRVCPQETQCEARCVREGKLGGAVAIGALERFAADYAAKHGDSAVPEIKKIGKRVAVVGSGPAGLTCAADLARAGVDVTVYEAFHKAGGVLTYGIPEFRLPKALVQREIDGLSEMGVNIELNTVVGKSVYLDELREEYDAVFIGSGAGLPMFMNIPGENLGGVYSANEFLTRVNLMKAYLPDSTTPVQRGKVVVVVGAGNVAMDSARTALRLGADKVYIMYRRSRDEMPARREEIFHAEEEGVELMLLTNPVEIVGEHSVEGVKAVKMELGEPDASGRRRPVVVPGSEFILPCDQVIMALGTSPNPLIRKSAPDLSVTPRGTLMTNADTLETSVDGVYAGGDAVTGAATVILAMGAGKKAAKAILERFNAVH